MSSFKTQSPLNWPDALFLAELEDDPARLLRLDGLDQDFYTARTTLLT